MGKTGNTIFVAVVTALTAIMAAGTSVHFVMAYSMRNDSNRSWWALLAAMVSCFCITFPLGFLAVDILDTQLCTTSALLMHIPGSEDGCFLPAGQIWLILEVINFIMAQFGVVFMISFLSIKHRRMSIRLGISLGWSMLMTFGMMGFTVLLYYVPGCVVMEYPAMALLSESVPFSVNATIPACPIPTHVAAYTLKDTENSWYLLNDTCSAFTMGPPRAAIATEPVHHTLPSAKYPANFTFLQFALAMYGFLGRFMLLPLLAVGLISHPMYLMMDFVNRPRMPLKKAEFIYMVRQWSNEARQIKLQAAQLDNEAKLSGMTWDLRQKLRSLSRQVADLELKEAAAEAIYPQRTRDPETTWTFHVIGIWAKALWSLIAAALSVGWILSMSLFVIPNPPLSLWFNNLVTFTKHTNFLGYMTNILDLLFTQLLTIYLLICTVCGLRKLQDILPSCQMYPYIRHGTRMISFFTNAWPLICCSRAILEFVSLNLSEAMANTSIHSNIIDQAHYILPVTWMKDHNVFPWLFLVYVAISIVAAPLHEVRKAHALRYNRPYVKDPTKRLPKKGKLASVLGMVRKQDSPVFTASPSIPTAEVGALEDPNEQIKI
mmetsp:Transcript_1570/g.4548  ORF Transcript_1570/g.4548 Transcript_1570/m.4548 type:complete len:603 (+) Transcript_1570:313-2121(+)|eukprot:CAMPEP_0117666368 /NCGR_PEP_ID=MMETSP0804-20121206/10339_1 /TAXON_ID=1074897 /ORGANISM="Tetraselmis astigmatica, Strain CCMP880" /LENGTH=602 /DNA_ID=CAMNT_0005473909 /DNA_START=239 /DNA_END=2047 /DNA_ORIENTATION=+